MNVIAFTKVALPYGWLGNMSPYSVVVAGKTWRTAEAAFQALRFDAKDPVREEIYAQRSPMGAKMVAKREAARMLITPWSQEDLELMDVVLQLKLRDHPELLVELRNTGDATIIEDCSNRPRGSGLFWGAALQVDGTWNGENHLGKLWMKRRGA